MAGGRQRWVASLLVAVLCATVLVVQPTLPPAGAVEVVPPDTPDKQISFASARWFRIPQIPMTGSGLDEIRSAIDTAEEAGYNGVLIGDSKINWYSTTARGAFNYDLWEQNLRTIMDYAGDRGIESILSIAPIGRCNALLANDPSLAAGFRLDTPLRMAGDGVTIESAVEPVVVDGGFDSYTGRSTLGWKGATSGFSRTTIDGEAALMGTGTGWSSVRQDLDLVPDTHYTLSVKVRADATFDATFVNLHVKAIDGAAITNELSSLRMSVVDGSGNRTYDLAAIPDFDPAVPSAVDWIDYKVAFNSVGHTRALLWIEIAGQTPGSTIWFDDVELRVDNTLNLIDRPGLLADDTEDAAEIVVIDSDGEWIAEQGRDFVLLDDNGGAVPGDPRIGNLHVDHDGPTLQIVEGSRLAVPDPIRTMRLHGYHALPHFAGSVACSWNDPRLFEAVGRVVAHAESFDPDAYLVPFDEVRAGGHERYDRPFDDSSAANARSSGALANSIAQVMARVRPTGKPMYIWNDMIDTAVNATDSFYHVRGSLTDPAAVPDDVTVLTWAEAAGGSNPSALSTRTAMLSNMAGLADKQIIASYYDQPALIEDDRKHWIDAWDAVPTANIAGAIYTTWQRRGNFNLGDYSRLAEFADLWWGQAAPVFEQQQPFRAHSVPGIVEAEHFDLGGAGVAWSDTDEFRGNDTLRADDGVDVYRTHGETDHTVGRTRGGEWLEYTIDAEPAEYAISARLASGYDFTTPTDVIVSVDGAELGRVPVDNTGGWWDWQEVTLVDGVTLDGTHVVRVTWGSPGFVNFDHLDVAAIAPSDACQGLTFEAESGTVSGAMKIIDEPTASGGASVGTPATSPNKYRFDDLDFVEYCIDVPTAGDYVITASVIAPDRRSDSLWVQTNNDEPVLWHIRQGSAWHDVAVQAAGTTESARFRFEAGTNWLRLYKREGGTLVDSLRISG